MSTSQVVSLPPAKDRGKRKLRKWRIELADRLQAIDLLAEGKTVDQVVELMAKKHPDWPLEKVRSAHFPKGLYSIHQFQGALQEEIDQAKIRLAKNHAANQTSGSRVFKYLHQDPEFVRQTRERSSIMMTKLHRDPIFAAQTAERGRRSIAKFHQDPKYIEASRKRITELQRDPDFIRKRRDGLARLWTPEKREEARQWMLHLHSDPEIVQRNRIAVAEARRTPEARERARQRMVEFNQDPGFQETRLVGMARLWSDPEFVERQREDLKLRNQDPDFIERILKGQARYWTPRHRQEARKRMLALFDDPEFIAARQRFWTEENRELARQRLIELRQEPAFQLALLVGRSKLWPSQTEKRQCNTLDDMGIAIVSKSREGWLTVGYTPTVMPGEMQELVNEALTQLKPMERRVIELAFFSNGSSADRLEMSGEEVSVVLKQALAKLAQDPILQELL